MSNVSLVIKDGILQVAVAGVIAEGNPVVTIVTDVKEIPDCDIPNDPAWTKREIVAQWVDVRFPINAVTLKSE